MINEKHIQKTEKNIQKLGYNVHVKIHGDKSSCYITVSKQEIELFCIRMSDHDLSEHNCMPEGVIADFVNPIKQITIKEIKELFDRLGQYSVERFEELWWHTNITDEQKQYIGNLYKKQMIKDTKKYIKKIIQELKDEGCTDQEIENVKKNYNKIIIACEN
jgi:hypothetical protein